MNRFQLERFWSKVIKSESDKCWKWIGSRSNGGYGTFTIITGKTTSAHKAMFEHINGTVLPGNYVLHSCDNPLCVNPNHLKEGTPKQNSKDASLKCRHFQQKRPLLNSQEVFKVRKLYDYGVSQADLVKLFKTSTRTIHKVIYRKALYEESPIELPLPQIPK